MSKLTKRERNIYNMGKQAGYYEGYAKGLYDGNPFNAIAKAITIAMNSIGEMLSDPDVVEALIEAERMEKEETENE